MECDCLGREHVLRGVLRARPVTFPHVNEKIERISPAALLTLIESQFN